MPQLSEVTEKPRFKKFRPWDLNGEGILSITNDKKNETEVIKSDTRGKQEVIKGGTRGKQEVKEGETRAEQEAKEETIRGNQGVNQEVDIDEIKFKLFSLIGNQKKIFIYILTLYRTKGNTTTGSIITKQMAIENGMSYYAVKDALKALIKKNLVKRLRGKACRGGFIHLDIPNVIKKISLIFFEREIIEREIRGTQGVKQEVELEEVDYSSSSFILNTTTTDVWNQRGNEWQFIDIDPLIQIGFTKKHLLQIANQNKLTAAIVQDSIYAFAFDLQENNKAERIKGDKISFFMGILCGGKPYLPPSGYESPQDKTMRLYIEKMRKIEQGRVEAEKEAMKLAFNEWFSELSKEQKKELLPPNLRNGAKLEKSVMLEGYAWNKFKDEIWRDKKNKILQEQEIDDIKSKEVITAE